MNATVTVNAGSVIVGLGKFAAGLRDRQELLNTLGQGQLVSIYKTFAEEGSPAGSWPRLAASTVRKKSYGAGHKLLILSGRLRNSIKAVVQGNSVVIGTNVVYAGVHQRGSRDRGVALDAVENPLQFLSSVKAHSRRQRSQDQVATYWKGGRTHTRIVAQGRSQVGSHSRKQNIPARPYLVFRPEDPERIRTQVQRFVTLRAQQAGLEAS